jgi:large subunit ribosomal protein L4
MTGTSLEVRAQDGRVTATVELDPEVFGARPNVHLMHQVVTAQLAAGRAGTQSTKTRAEVSGGGAKPYKQKGTGRARQGSTRAPHFAGGGVGLGPKPRSYRQRTPRKMIQLALRGALSDRAGAGQVMVVEGWDFDVPSTKAARAALSALGITGRAMIVLSRGDERAFKSFRNLTEIDIVLSGELAAYDVLCSDSVVFTRQTLPGNNSWAEAPAADAEVTKPAPPPGPDAQPGTETEPANAEIPSEVGDEETVTEPVPAQAMATADEAATAPATAGEAAAPPETEEGA